MTRWVTQYLWFLPNQWMIIHVVASKANPRDRENQKISSHNDKINGHVKSNFPQFFIILLSTFVDPETSSVRLTGIRFPLRTAIEPGFCPPGQQPALANRHKPSSPILKPTQLLLLSQRPASDFFLPRQTSKEFPRKQRGDPKKNMNLLSCFCWFEMFIEIYT